MNKYIFTCCNTFFLVFMLSCNAGDQKLDRTTSQSPNLQEIPATPSAKSILALAIEKTGMVLLKNASVSFDFRERHYTYSRKKGVYRYERIFKDENGNEITDALDNVGFLRLTNGDTSAVEDKKAKTYANSVNSVIYFAFLPFSLNDPAVISEYLEKVNLKGKEYHKIRVTFKQESGGDDFQDVFVYWFDTENYRMDYLAYEYHTDEGGMRFREAFNAREVSGVLFQDYKNFKPSEKGTIKLEAIDQAFESGALELLSEIVLENVKVVVNQE